MKLVLKADEEFCKMTERGGWEIYFFKRTKHRQKFNI